METITPSYHASSYAAPVTEHRFSPYTDNGGTILGIRGKDFVVLAGDTRSTQGYNINSRNERKVYVIGEKLVLATVGFGADAKAVVERVRRQCEDYKFQHGRPISVAATAQYLMTYLYSNRFFPKYAYCVLGGLGPNNEPQLFSYDPVGSYSKEGESRAAAGAASSLLVPFLDSVVDFKNRDGPHGEAVRDLEEEEAIKIVKDGFHGITERHIEVGDGLQMVVINAEGIREEIVPLKRD